jgi:catalase
MATGTDSFGGPTQDPKYTERPYTTSKTVEKIGRYDHREGNDDNTQAGNLWRLFDDGQKDRTAAAIAGSLGQVPLRIQKLQLSHFKKADPDFAYRIVKALNTDEHPEYLHGPDAADLPPAARLAEK